MKELAVAIVILLAIGCAVKRDDTPQSPSTGDMRSLLAWDDSLRGITCYHVQGYDGLSCVRTRQAPQPERAP